MSLEKIQAKLGELESLQEQHSNLSKHLGALSLAAESIPIPALLSALRKATEALGAYTYQDNTYDSDIMTDGAVAREALSEIAALLGGEKETTPEIPGN